MDNKKIIFTIISSQILIYLSLYLWLKSRSGGDMAFVLFNTAFTILNLLAWGIVSFNWERRKKKVVIFSFVVVILIEFLVFQLFM